MKTFKENLRDELNFQGMTVKELAAKTGIIKGSLDNYLGVRASIPPADVAVKIAKSYEKFLFPAKKHAIRDKRVVKSRCRKKVIAATFVRGAATKTSHFPSINP